MMNTGIREKCKIIPGTAGWMYDDWVGTFYPREQGKEFHFLEWYSQFFEVVEVNVSYYRYVQEHIVKAWIDLIPGEKNFKFIMKLNKDFSHSRNYSRYSLNNLERTTGLLREHERLAGVLAQFPYSFLFNEVNYTFLRRLSEDINSLPVFLELRHKSWQQPTASEALARLPFHPVMVDMPPVGEAIPLLPSVIGGIAYLRLHGRNKHAWMESVKNFGQKRSYSEQSMRYQYAYSVSELHEIKNVIEEIIGSTRELYIIANNHPGAAAAANALELLHLLDQSATLKAPNSLIKQFTLPPVFKPIEYAPTVAKTKNMPPSLFD